MAIVCGHKTLHYSKDKSSFPKCMFNCLWLQLSLLFHLYRVAKKKNQNGILPTICGFNNWYQCMR